MSKRNKILTVCFILGCLLVVLAGIGTEIVSTGIFRYQNRVSEGVRIGSLDVGGMTRQETSDAVETYVSQVMQSNVVIQISDHQLETTLEELGLDCSPEETVEKAYQLGKQGNPWKRLKTLEQVKMSGKQYTLPYKISKDSIQAFVEEQCRQFDVKAKSSKLKFKNGKLKATKDRTGHELQVEETVEKIQQAVEEAVGQENSESTSGSSENGDTTGRGLSAITIEAVVKDTEPEYTKEEVSQCKDLLSTYSTSYSTSTAARANNVKTATNYINGTVLYPGKTFSTIKVIKDRTEANGYQAAPEYSSGNVVDGVGGGVCQVSTTLYNAVINAELEIVERSPHSMVVSYVDVSRDAAISGDYKDFKFKNNTDHPIYIAGSASGGTLTFRIYGKETRPDNRKISFESEILETIEPGSPVETVDSSKPASYREVTQSAHVGYKAKLWKIVTVDGVQTEKTEFNSSSYNAEPEHITVGASKATATPKPSAKTTGKPKDKKGQATKKPAATSTPKATVKARKKTAPTAAPTKKQDAATNAPTSGQ